MVEETFEDSCVFRINPHFALILVAHDTCPVVFTLHIQEAKDEAGSSEKNGLFPF